MSGRLIRVLSTGRAGTKFLADTFTDQGCVSFHEDLYIGEPSSAVLLYLQMLGDLWKQNRSRYFEFESNFMEPYVRTVAEHLDKDSKEKNKILGKLRGKLSASSSTEKEDFVIHTAHLLTAATPMIERELKRTGIESRNLILFRNPLKTIHAIYLVEEKAPPGERPYRMRPAMFVEGEGFVGAASIWANTYRMAFDQGEQLGRDKFLPVDLEIFSSDQSYAGKVFEFIGLDFDFQRFDLFSKRELNKPFRSSKSDSTRNSHLFHNPEMVFSPKQIEQIYGCIGDVIELYGLSWEKVVREYQTFHEREKNQVGFA